MKRGIFILSVLLNLITAGYLIYNKVHENLNYKIVFFGDSLTDQLGKSGYVNKHNTYFSGNPGFTTSHYVWILKDRVLKFHPDTCYIQGGINDIGAGIPLSRTFKNFDSIFIELSKNHITPIVQSTLYTYKYPEYSNKIDSLNSYLIAACKQRHYRYINLNSCLSSHRLLKQALTIDGLHLNKNGLKQWAACL